MSKASKDKRPIIKLRSTAGSYAATGDEDGVVRLWSPRLRDLPVGTLQCDREVTALAWNPLGSQLAVGTASGEVIVAEVEAGQLL